MLSSDCIFAKDGRWSLSPNLLSSKVSSVNVLSKISYSKCFSGSELREIDPTDDLEFDDDTVRLIFWDVSSRVCHLERYRFSSYYL